jgi:DNA-binding NarL/FixJ family response regulator
VRTGDVVASGDVRVSGSVVIVDHDAEQRGLLSGALRRAGYLPIELESGHDVLEHVRDDGATAVVLEVSLPGLSGYSVCRQLREAVGEDLPIIFVSGSRTEPHDRVAGLLVGADEYLAKPVAPEELLLRISRLLRRSGGRPPTPVLTRRELEILRLLAYGKSHKEIAHDLYLSRKTVGTHVERLYRKLGAHSRQQAVTAARRHGLMPL